MNPLCFGVFPYYHSSLWFIVLHHSVIALLYVVVSLLLIDVWCIVLDYSWMWSLMGYLEQVLRIHVTYYCHAVSVHMWPVSQHVGVNTCLCTLHFSCWWEYISSGLWLSSILTVVQLTWSHFVIPISFSIWLFTALDDCYPSLISLWSFMICMYSHLAVSSQIVLSSTLVLSYHLCLFFSWC